MGVNCDVKVRSKGFMSTENTIRFLYGNYYGAHILSGKQCA